MRARFCALTRCDPDEIASPYEVPTRPVFLRAGRVLNRLDLPQRYAETAAAATRAAYLLVLDGVKTEPNVPVLT